MLSNDTYEINKKRTGVIKWSEEWSSKLWTQLMQPYTLREKSLYIFVKILNAKITFYALHHSQSRLFFYWWTPPWLIISFILYPSEMKFPQPLHSFCPFFIGRNRWARRRCFSFILALPPHCRFPCQDLQMEKVT